MPTDASIPLQIRPPQINVGAVGQSLGNLALMQDRQAQVEQRRRALEDDAATRLALQTSPTPDDAVHLLVRQGRFTAAQNLSKGLLATRKQQSDAAISLVTQQERQIDFATRILSTATDQKSWDSAYEAVSSMNMPPQIMSMVPKEYDPKEQQRLLSLGLSAKDHLTEQHQALQDHDRALQLAATQARDADTQAQKRLQIAVLKRRAAGTLLSTAQNQDDLDRYQKLLAGQGYEPALLAEFGNTWSPDFQQRALDLASTPAERNTAAHQRVLEQQGAERNRLAADRLAFAKAGGIGGTPRVLTPGQRAIAERAKTAAYTRLERSVRSDPDNLDANGGLTPEALDELGQQKLQVENSYRTQIGLPSLEDAEGYYASTPGLERDLAIVQSKYRAITGKRAPIDNLMTAIRQTTDPRKKAALVKQLRDIRAQYAGNDQEDQ